MTPRHPAVSDPPLGADDAFYDTYLVPLEKRMLHAVWRVLRDPERARDALQEALALIWQRRARIRAHPNPEALVLRICIHAAVDMLRRDQRRRRVAEASARLNPEPALPPGPAEGAQAHQLREQVLAALAHLPAKQATAVLLRVLHEEDYADIAAALRCSQTTARIHVMRGRARLGRLLAHLGFTPGHSGGSP